MRVPAALGHDDHQHLRAQSQNLSFSSCSRAIGVTSAVVKAGHGFAFAVKKGQKFRITDLHGGQIVDFLAWKQIPFPSSNSNSSFPPTLANPQVRFSAGSTRWHLAGATPALGEHLYTNTGEPIFTITADTVKVHDMTFPCCYPELYESEGRSGHRACASNISEAMTLAKYWPAARNEMDHKEVPDPFNVFQNTPFYKLNGDLLNSRKGDVIEMVAEMDVVCAVSSCPYDLNGFGKPTEVEISIGI